MRLVLLVLVLVVVQLYAATNKLPIAVIVVAVIAKAGLVKFRSSAGAVAIQFVGIVSEPKRLPKVVSKFSHDKVPNAGKLALPKLLIMAALAL